MSDLIELAAQARREKDFDTAAAAWLVLDATRAAAQADSGPAITQVGGDGISGHLGSAAPGRRVHLLVNGQTIFGTAAAQPRADLPGHAPNGFRIPMAGLWPYFGKGDRLEVQDADGTALAFPSGQHFLDVHATEKSRVPTLLKKLQGDFIISKNGKLLPKFNANSEYVQDSMKVFFHVHDILLRDCDRKLIPICGTLLGIVRSEDFIPSDDDLDVTFVSPHSEPEAVKQDYISAAEALMAAGYRILFRPNCFRIFKDIPGSRKCFGVFISWRDPDDRFAMSFGHYGEAPVLDWPVTCKPARLGPWTVDIPVQSEGLLEYNFGKSWRIPDPGFSHADKTVDRREFRFTGKEQKLLNRKYGGKP